MSDKDFKIVFSNSPERVKQFVENINGGLRQNYDWKEAHAAIRHIFVIFPLLEDEWQLCVDLELWKTNKFYQFETDAEIKAFLLGATLALELFDKQQEEQ